jgi:hypothetical protein
MKLVLLWLDSDQELNKGDIEDFLLFPTGLHTPSYDQWFKRYGLSNFTKVAGILHWTDLVETDYFEFFTNIQNENSRNFEYQTCRCLYQFSIKYLHALLR